MENINDFKKKLFDSHDGVKVLFNFKLSFNTYLETSNILSGIAEKLEDGEVFDEAEAVKMLVLMHDSYLNALKFKKELTGDDQPVLFDIYKGSYNDYGIVIESGRVTSPLRPTVNAANRIINKFSLNKIRDYEVSLYIINYFKKMEEII